MPRIAITAALFVALLVSLPGCGSICNYATGDPEVYGGVQKDMGFISGGGGHVHVSNGKGAVAVVAIVLADMGLSGAVDTLTLPLTIWLRQNPSPDEDESNSDSGSPSPGTPMQPISLVPVGEGQDADEEKGLAGGGEGGLTRQSYDRISNGMSLQAVQAILGSDGMSVQAVQAILGPGEEPGSSGMQGQSPQIYMWLTGVKVISVTFRNGQVSAKTQMGL